MNIIYNLVGASAALVGAAFLTEVWWLGAILIMGGCIAAKIGN